MFTKIKVKTHKNRVVVVLNDGIVTVSNGVNVYVKENLLYIIKDVY